MIEKKYIKNMNITIKNNITGLINSIEFKLFEEFNTQNEYMGYLIHSMNINMDSILHIKARTQQHFTKEHLRMYLVENGFMEEALKNTAVKRIAQMEYCEMMSSICIESCMVHYKKTLRPDLERRKKLADEYQRNFLGNLDEKKT